MTKNVTVIPCDIERFKMWGYTITIKPNRVYDTKNTEVYICIDESSSESNHGYAAFDQQGVFDIIKALAETANLNVLKVGQRLCIREPELQGTDEHARKEEIATELFTSRYGVLKMSERTAVDRIFELEKKVAS